MRIVDYAILMAVAALLVVVVFVFFPKGPSKATLDSAYQFGCAELTGTYACDQGSINDITAYQTKNTVYTLGTLCAQREYTDTFSCARSCGCSLTSDAGEPYTLSAEPTKSYGPVPVSDGVFIEEGVIPDES